MHGFEHAVGFRSEDRTWHKRLTILISPLLLQACKPEWMLVMQEKEEGLLPTAFALPLVEAIRGDNTASLFESLAKGRLLSDCLATSVDKLCAYRGIFGPGRSRTWNYPQLHSSAI